MANGLGDFLPFQPWQPKGGAITPVQMPISRLGGVTPRGGGGGSRDTNPGAGIIPYLGSMLADKFGKTQTQLPKAAPPQPLSRTGGITRADIDQQIMDQADYLTDQLFGGQVIEEKNLFGKAAPYLSLMGGLAFDDPSEQTAYLRSFGDIQKAKATAKARGDPRSAYKQELIKQQLGKTYGVAPAYLIGDDSKARNAITAPNGVFLIHSQGEAEDRDVKGNRIEAGKYYVSPEWIRGEPPVADLTKFSSSSNEARKNWRVARDDVEETANLLQASLPAIFTVISTLNQNPEAATWWSPINRIKGEIKAFGRELYDDNKELYKLAEDEGRLTWYKPSEGLTENSLIADTSTDNFTYIEEVWDSETGKMVPLEKTFSWQGTFGDIGQDAAFRSAMLNMAYVAAASTGNTGKALSDKDLALHLMQLGDPFEGGGIKGGQAVIRGMTSWYGDQLRKVTSQAKSLETGSLGADYRRIFNEPTPWAEKWYEGEPDEKNIRKIKPPTAFWIQEGDENFYKYLEAMYRAQELWGNTVLPPDPIIGFDWQGFLRNKAAGQVTTPTPPGGVPVPPPGSRIFGTPPPPPSY